MSDSFSIMLDPPLRQLLVMQSKGKIRRTWKRLSSPRRAIPTVIVAVMMLLYVGQVYIALAYNTTTRTFPIEAIAPLGFLSILFLKLLGVCIDRKKSGAGYRHEETHRLLGGPFSHQQVRLFRTAGHAISIFATSIFAAVFFRFHVTSLIAALTGSYLAMLFTYLVYTLIAIAAMHANEKLYKTTRNVVVASVVAMLIYVFYRVSLTGASNLAFMKEFGNEAIAISQTPLGRFLMSPFLIFTKIVMASSVREWALCMVPGLALNYLALQAMMRTEVQFDVWAQRREREEFVRNSDSLIGPNARTASLDLSQLAKPIAFLEGMGPIAWRQYKALARLKGGLGWLLIPLGLAFAAGGYIAFDPKQGAFHTIAVIVVLTSVFLPGLLPFDFRGDLKGLAALKMMPLKPRSVVLGQLLVPIVLLSGFQLLALSTLILHDRNLVTNVMVTMCFLLPVNTAIIALENLIFLLYPYRVAEFDMQATVRRIVMLMAKFCVVFFGFLLAILAGLGVFGLNWLAKSTSPGLSQAMSTYWQPIVLSTQLLALGSVSAFVVWMTCWAYRRFDLSEDLPA